MDFFTKQIYQDIENLLKKTFLGCTQKNVLKKIDSLGYIVLKEFSKNDVLIYKCFKSQSLAKMMYVVIGQKDVSVIVDIETSKEEADLVFFSTLTIDFEKIKEVFKNFSTCEKEFEKLENEDNEFLFLKEFMIFGRFNKFFNKTAKAFSLKNLCFFLAGMSSDRKYFEELSARK